MCSAKLGLMICQLHWYQQYSLFRINEFHFKLKKVPLRACHFSRFASPYMYIIYRITYAYIYNIFEVNLAHQFWMDPCAKIRHYLEGCLTITEYQRSAMKHMGEGDQYNFTVKWSKIRHKPCTFQGGIYSMRANLHRTEIVHISMA